MCTTIKTGCPFSRTRHPKDTQRYCWLTLCLSLLPQRLSPPPRSTTVPFLQTCAWRSTFTVCTTPPWTSPGSSMASCFLRSGSIRDNSIRWVGLGLSGVYNHLSVLLLKAVSPMCLYLQSCVCTFTEGNDHK